MTDANSEVDYRGFLRLRLEQGDQAELGRHLERARSWVSAMLSGTRRLKPSLAPKVADFLNLDDEDRAFFLALVDLEEGGSEHGRRQALSIIRSMAILRSMEERRQDQLYAIEKWYVACVLELAKCEGFRPDPRWIARTLNPPITVIQATQAVTLLIRLGLLDVEGRASPDATLPLFTALDVPERGREAARRFHRDTMGLAGGASDRFYEGERHLGSGCFAVSEQDFDEIRERFREAYIQVIADVSASRGTPNRVYAFAVGLFPMSDYTDSVVDEEPESAP